MTKTSKLNRIDRLPKDPETRKLWREFAAKLRKIREGQVVWVGQEPHLELLAKNGVLCENEVQIQPGQPNRCHLNAAMLWARDVKNTKLVTGYALSGDIWVAHSWATRNGTILETTVQRDCYFGVELDEIQSLLLLMGSIRQEVASPQGVVDQMVKLPQVRPVLERFVQAVEKDAVGRHVIKAWR